MKHAISKTYNYQSNIPTVIRDQIMSNTNTNPKSAEIFVYKPWRTKGFLIWNRRKYLSQLFLLHLNTYVVCRRQILTSNVDPRTERVKPTLLSRCIVFSSWTSQSLLTIWMTEFSANTPGNDCVWLIFNRKKFI